MPSKRIIAFDWGEKRIGVAVSDPLNLTAQGLENIANGPGACKIIVELVKEYDPSEIVIGLPRNLNGTLSESGKAVERFADELKRHLAVPIVFWDEWLTTSEAEKHLINADRSRRKRKLVIDRIAAQLILTGYLESRSKKV